MQIALTINAKNAFPHSLNKYWKKAFALLLCILHTRCIGAKPYFRHRDRLLIAEAHSKSQHYVAERR